MKDDTKAEKVTSESKTESKNFFLHIVHCLCSLRCLSSNIICLNPILLH